MTGTEAHPWSGALPKRLHHEARGAGYRLWLPPGGEGTWIAINERYVRRWQASWQPVIPGRRGLNPRGIVRASFSIPGAGRITVLASHYLPRRMHDARAANRRLTRALATDARRFAKGTRLVFFGGDVNTRSHSPFPKTALQPCWARPPGVDVIANWRHDTRVRLRSARVLPLRLHSYHRAITATYSIRTIRTTKGRPR